VHGEYLNSGGNELTVFSHPNSALSQCGGDREKAAQKATTKVHLKPTQKSGSKSPKNQRAKMFKKGPDIAESLMQAFV
jgi:hypothetical protein